MVKEVEKNGKTLHMCEACDMYYKESFLAQQCEEYCNKYHACNIEITRRAVKV